METVPANDSLAPAGLAGTPLDEGDLAQAYALVALCEGAVSLEGWRRHVTACGCASAAHWCAIRDSRGYMHALFSHRVEHDLVAGRLLDIDDILAAGPRWQAALAEIDRCAARLATEAGCLAVRIRLDPGRTAPGPDALRRVLGARGFRDRGPDLWRTLAPA